MIFPFPGKRLLGTALPLSALWTAESAGVGEFPDLPAFGEWCRDCGIGLIQLLPVNDSGDHASPYFALSAFALHPLYLRLSALPEAASIGPRIAELKKRFPGGERLRYKPLLDAKVEALREAFEQNRKAILDSSELERWIGGNPWIKPYAAFKRLKELNHSLGWREWKDSRDPEPAEIDRMWKDGKARADLMFFAWVQMRAEEQFRAAASALEGMGVALKGDLPILLNEDSADIWSDRGAFRTDFRAGAPPDGESPLGQNWGFPLYDWEALARRGYDFWKRRLVQADKFYHAYRIDHVLGFFRIWAVPSADSTAALGRFLPSVPVTVDSLRAAGFGEARLRWLAEPHIPLSAIRGALNGLPAMEEEIRLMADLALDRVGGEDLFTFKSAITGERDIDALGLDGRTRGFLRVRWRDRCLLAQDGGYLPQWSYWHSSAWASLSDGERAALECLFRESRARSEERWEREGREILEVLVGSSGMLPCAEDLGAVPDFVPGALSGLGILGLRIARWTRRWNEPGQPFILPSKYPAGTVSALSVHDTSTLREWWESGDEKRDFYYAVGGSGECPGKCSPEVAEFALAAMARGASRLFVPCAQDLLALSENLKPQDPREERVNVPGTDDERNWSYRLPASVEDMASDARLKAAIRRVASARNEGGQ